MRGNEFTVFQTDKFKFSSPICYESVLHNIARNFVKAGAEIIINIANDLWTKSEQEHKQHFVMNVFTAVQNHVPVFRNGNSGISGYINQIGQIKYSSSPMKKSYDTIKIEFSKTFIGSFYTRYGDIFAQMCTLFSGIFIFLSLFYIKKE
jgi:apolipoprotein N-acyltransferase